MDKWFVNMVAGAVLSALLVLFGAGVLVDEIYPTGGQPEAPPPPSETADAEGGAPAEAAPQVSLASLLGQATVEAGETQARKCVACHTFDEGGANKIGPNLHGILGRQVATVEGFAYSPALTEYGGNWDYEKMDCFLLDPKGCVPGNKMSFAGVKRDTERADVIAYLRSISPDAPPLPEDKSAEAAPAEAAPAEAEQQQAAEPAAGDQEQAATTNEQPQEAEAPADSEAQATESSEQPAAAETAEQPAAADAAQTEEPAASTENAPAAEASTTGGSSQN
ncbi:MAG: c-type cytochrome [Rhodomicrobiaceae bacterium]